jgi:hypothetical protein
MKNKLYFVLLYFYDSKREFQRTVQLPVSCKEEADRIVNILKKLLELEEKESYFGYYLDDKNKEHIKILDIIGKVFSFYVEPGFYNFESTFDYMITTQELEEAFGSLWRETAIVDIIE